MGSTVNADPDFVAVGKLRALGLHGRLVYVQAQPPPHRDRVQLVGRAGKVSHGSCWGADTRFRLRGRETIPLGCPRRIGSVATRFRFVSSTSSPCLFYVGQQSDDYGILALQYAFGDACVVGIVPSGQVKSSS